jgi:hypothetical protein
MSSIYFQGSEALALASSGPECEPSRSAKSIHTAAPCSDTTGQMSLFTTTCEALAQRALPKMWATPQARDYFPAHSPEYIASKRAQGHGMRNLNDEVSMSSAAVSPARIFPSPARAQDWQASAAVYGRSTPELLARFDPDTSSWKMLRPCLFGEWDEFSGIFPPSGMTRSGALYQLPTSALPTCENGSGLWRTPDASVVTGGAANAEDRKRQGHAIGLHDQVNTPSMWPTPHGMCVPNKRRAGPSGNELGRAVNRSLWPTPSASLGDHAGLVTPTKAREGGTLVEAVSARTMFPTPTVQDASNNGGASQYERNSLPLNAQVGGALNPTWVEWLMGFPLGWTACDPSAMPSCRKSPKSSDGQS